MLKKNIDKLGSINDIVKVKEAIRQRIIYCRKGHGTPCFCSQFEADRKGKDKDGVAVEGRKGAGTGSPGENFCGFMHDPVKANEEGKLFGSVTPAQIAEALAKEGYPVDKEMIKIRQSYKSLRCFLMSRLP